MAQQTLLGGDGTTGESGATHNSKANSNFTELYGATAAAQADADAANSALSSHISTTAAHIAANIAFTAYGSIASTNVQAAIQEMLDEGVSVPDATASVKGIGKLYTTTGAATDGSMTQAAITAAFGGVKAEVFVTTTSKTASYTLAAAELTLINAGAQLVMEMNSASALTLTIPTNAARAFPVGTKVGWRQAGAGVLTIAPDGGVTMRAANNANKAYAQYSMGYIEKVATDEWYLGGDITV
jgi:hypothetical protein